MKKLFLLILLGLLVCFEANNAQTQTIINNNCSSATSGWTFTNGGGNAIQAGGYWLLDNVGDSIISETINVSSYTDLSLTFQVATYGSGTNHNCLIEYSTDNGSNWSSTTFTSATPTSSTYISAGTFALGTQSTTQLKLRWTSPSGGSKGVRMRNIVLTGTEMSDPTTQSSITFGTVTTNSIVVNFNGGDGAGRILIAKAESAADFTPVNGTAYEGVNSNFGLAFDQGSGNKVVYDGSGNSVTVTGLLSSTTYHFAVYEYNGSGSGISYLTTAPGTGNQLTTTPVDPAATISHAGLTEENLNGAVINLTLTNDNFADASLDISNFVLNNEPVGTTISAVEYVNDSEAIVTLAYDGTDFDANVTNFQIGIDNSELTESSSLLISNSLAILATVETVPTVTTNAAITSNSAVTAVWGGEVTENGGETVTQKGVVWSTSANPTTADNKTEEGTGIGAITGNMSGLTSNTTYYVRAYATNSVGTSYGDEHNFTTENISAPLANSGSSITTTSFMASWNLVSEAESYKLDVSNYENFSNTSNATDLFISEYYEGTSNNKYVELFNKTGATVSLDNYSLKLASNGGDWATTTALTGNLADNTTYVICHSSAIQSIKDKADITSSTAVNFNGNDAVGLFKDNVLIDVFGNPTTGTNFDVAGVSGAAVDHNIIRKSNITNGNTDWTLSSGTTTENSEWIVYSLGAIDDEGMHTYGQDSFIDGFNDLTVNSTSREVSGLTEGETYYYRVRAYSSTSTSSNSEVIRVTTLGSNGLNGNANAGNNQNINIGNGTGVGQITFGNVTHGGNVLVNRYNNAPSNSNGVVGNVSHYRWVIEPNNQMVFVEGDGYVLRFEVADCPGIAELADGNNTTVKLYKRSNPGHGNFDDCGFLTYHRNGTNGNQADDYLTSATITTGFSEFVFGSSESPLPVELSSFTATTAKDGVVLNWATATEINNNRFEVERKIAENNWEKIATIDGHGNSNSVKEYTYTDNNLSTAGTYSYRLKQVDNDGQFTYSSIVEVNVEAPKEFGLVQNYPNPFNPETTISYSIPQSSNVKLIVFNALGQEVMTLVNGYFEAGNHSVNFNASNLPSGVYFYQMQAGSFTSVKKMVLTK